MTTILIRSGAISIQAELLENETAKAIKASLPVSGTANIWGDEIYFEIPVSIDLDADARSEVDIGDLGYWPPGHAFCIFFGRTPMSSGETPRAASPVNIFGKIVGDVSILKSIPSGAEITIEAAS